LISIVLAGATQIAAPKSKTLLTPAVDRIGEADLDQAFLRAAALHLLRAAD